MKRKVLPQQRVVKKAQGVLLLAVRSSPWSGGEAPQEHLEFILLLWSNVRIDELYHLPGRDFVRL